MTEHRPDDPVVWRDHEDILVALRRLWRITGLLVLVVAGNSVLSTYLLSENRHNTSRNHAAICKLEAGNYIGARADRAGAQAILTANPNGTGAFTKPVIQKAIRDDSAKMRANADLSCPPIPPLKKPKNP